MKAYTTWNLMLNGQRWAQVTFASRFTKKHVEECSRMKYNLKELVAEESE